MARYLFIALAFSLLLNGKALSAAEEVVLEVQFDTPADGTESFVTTAYIDGPMIWLDVEELFDIAGLISRRKDSTIEVSNPSNNAQYALQISADYSDGLFVNITELEEKSNWSLSYDPRKLSLVVRSSQTLPSDRNSMREQLTGRGQARRHNIVNTPFFGSPSLHSQLSYRSSATSPGRFSVDNELLWRIGSARGRYSFDLDRADGLSNQRLNLSGGYQKKYHWIIGDLDFEDRFIGGVHGRGFRLHNATAQSGGDRIYVSVSQSEEAEVYIDDVIVGYIDAGPARELSFLLNQQRSREHRIKIVRYPPNAAPSTKEFSAYNGMRLDGLSWGLLALQPDTYLQDSGAQPGHHIRSHVGYKFDNSLELKLRADQVKSEDDLHYSHQRLSSKYQAKWATLSASAASNNHNRALFDFALDKSINKLNVNFRTSKTQAGYFDPNQAEFTTNSTAATRSSLSISSGKIRLKNILLNGAVSASREQIAGMQTLERRFASLQLNSQFMTTYLSGQSDNLGQKTQKLTLSKGFEYLQFNYSIEYSRSPSQRSKSQRINLSIPERKRGWGNWNLQFKQIDDDMHSQRLSWNKDFERFALNLDSEHFSGGNWHFSVGLSTRLIADAKHRKLYATRDPLLSHQGDLLFDIALREDGEAALDLSQINLKLDKLGTTARQVGDHSVLFTNLSAGVNSEIQLDTENSDLGYLQPIQDLSQNIVNIESSTLGYAELELAITGEIEGVVYFDDQQPISGIALNLIDKHGKRVAQTRSAYDGYYSFSAVLPGRYQLLTDQAEMELLKITPPADTSLNVVAEELTVLDLRYSDANPQEISTEQNQNTNPKTDFSGPSTATDLNAFSANSVDRFDGGVAMAQSVLPQAQAF